MGKKSLHKGGIELPRSQNYHPPTRSHPNYSRQNLPRYERPTNSTQYPNYSYRETRPQSVPIYASPKTSNTATILIKILSILIAFVLILLIGLMLLNIYGVPQSWQDTSFGQKLESLMSSNQDSGNTMESTYNPYGISFGQSIPQYTSENNGHFKTGALLQMEVGKDIPPGEYFVACRPNVDKAFVEIAKGKKQDVQSLIYNNNLRTFTFVTLSVGEYFTCVGGTAVNVKNAQLPQPNAQGQYPEGTYRIGKDLPEGTYQITANPNDTVTMEIRKDSTWLDSSKQTSQESKSALTVSVSQGDYLTVRGGMIQKISQ